MEVLLFNQKKYQEKYNCSFYNTSIIPIEERRHRFLGTFVLISYVFFMTLYILCLYLMFSLKLRTKASYKLMILLGLIHITGLQVSGLLTGFLAFQGAVFCTNPTLIYIGGAVGVATWCGSTCTSMILGLNRCCALYGDSLSTKMFGSWRLWIWMSLPCFYMFYVIFFTPPPLFSGVLMAWFFNPHLGYYDDFGSLKYHSVVHSSNNIFVCATESILYSTLILLYLRATKSVMSSQIKAKFRREKRIYIQVVLVGVIHFGASFCYVLMQYIEFNFYTTLIASTFYLLSQGFPPIIYLFVNQTLRNTLLMKLGHGKGGTGISPNAIINSHTTPNQLSNQFTKVTPYSSHHLNQVKEGRGVMVSNGMFSSGVVSNGNSNNF